MQEYEIDLCYRMIIYVMFNNKQIEHNTIADVRAHLGFFFEPKVVEGALKRARGEE